ncbi:hypothetical protein BIW11_04171 [Tropilaelaps mercedesae]|uniref:Uncharacterized protein n=1 Tax=Tropilaelaps mercedesae TaxID=418985 RepID=A0A1V9XA14_9ACAR|nr:hypothetical protein BIW11_04171 [Tropilaelaps mercedesae]
MHITHITTNIDQNTNRRLAVEDRYGDLPEAARALEESGDNYGKQQLQAYLLILALSFSSTALLVGFPSSFSCDLSGPSSLAAASSCVQQGFDRPSAGLSRFLCSINSASPEKERSLMLKQNEAREQEARGPRRRSTDCCFISSWKLHFWIPSHIPQKWFRRTDTSQKRRPSAQICGGTPLTIEFVHHRLAWLGLA